MYRVVYKKVVLKSMRKMPKGIRERMQAELHQIAEDPSQYTGDWKPLTGASLWRLRVGSYRAICDLRDNELILLVLNAGPRGDIYK